MITKLIIPAVLILSYFIDGLRGLGICAVFLIAGYAVAVEGRHDRS